MDVDARNDSKTTGEATAIGALRILKLKAAFESALLAAYRDHSRMTQSDGLEDANGDRDAVEFLHDSALAMATIGAWLEDLAEIAETAMWLTPNHRELSPEDGLVETCAKAAPHLDRLARNVGINALSRGGIGAAALRAFRELSDAVSDGADGRRIGR